MSSKRSKGGYYGVQKGRTTGVFSTWSECEAQTKGFTGARYKKFATHHEAEQFVAGDEPSDSLSSTGTTTDAASSLKGKKRALSADVEDESGWEVVYGDGACKGNGRDGSVAGVGVWWGENDPRNIAERCPGEQTNNRAELIAILRVLEETPFSNRPLLIKSDSQYSINCFKSWIKGWMRNGFRTGAGAPVKNAGIIRCISKLLDIRARHGQRVRLQYVKGHSGHIGNDGADEMANRGTTLPLVNDRNWAELEERLTIELEKVISKHPEASFEVQGPDEPIDTVSTEGKSKVRKLSSGSSQAFDPSKTGASWTLTNSPSKQSNNFSAHPPALSTPNPSGGTRMPYSTSGTSAHGNTTTESQTFEITSKQSKRTMVSPEASAARLSMMQQALSPSKSPPEDLKVPQEKISLDALSRNVKTPPSYDRPEHLQSTKSSDMQHGGQWHTQSEPRRQPKSPLKVIYAAPPLIPVREEIDPNDYANYFADPDDLAKELLE